MYQFSDPLVLYRPLEASAGGMHSSSKRGNKATTGEDQTFGGCPSQNSETEEEFSCTSHIVAWQCAAVGSKGVAAVLHCL